MFGGGASNQTILPSAYFWDPQFIAAMIVGCFLCIPWRELASRRSTFLGRATALGAPAVAPMWRGLSAAIASVVLILLLLAAVIHIAGGTYSAFIYAQF